MAGTGNIELKGSFKVNAVNKEEAQNMQSAVADYKKGIDEILEKITNKGKDEYLVAMRGEEQISAIQTYIGECVDSLKEITEYIDQFQEGINDVMEAYDDRQSSIEAKVTNVDDLGDEDFTGVNGFSG